MWVGDYLKKYIILFSTVALFFLLFFFSHPLYRNNYEVSGNPNYIYLDGENYICLNQFSGYRYNGDFETDNNYLVYQKILGLYLRKYTANKSLNNNDGTFIKTNEAPLGIAKYIENIYYNEEIELPLPKQENIESVVIRRVDSSTVITDAELISEMCKFVDKEHLDEFPFEKFIDINNENDASGYFSVSLKFKDFTYLEFNIGEWILDEKDTGKFYPELM